MLNELKIITIEAIVFKKKKDILCDLFKPVNFLPMLRM
jgi:hypothetical protein